MFLSWKLFLLVVVFVMVLENRMSGVMKEVVMLDRVLFEFDSSCCRVFWYLWFSGCGFVWWVVIICCR